MVIEHFFPRLFYINTLRRQDRRNNAEALFAGHRLQVPRFAAVDKGRVRKLEGYTQSSPRAVAMSKRLVVLSAKLARSDTIFLFEDDVVLHGNWRELLGNINLPDDWGVFFLGCQHLERPIVIGPGIVRATYPVDHHAVGIRAEYFERILRTWRVGSGKAGHDGTAMNLPRTNSDVELARLAKEIPMYAC